MAFKTAYVKKRGRNYKKRRKKQTKKLHFLTFYQINYKGDI